MEITPYIAVYGAVISTIALAWNIYRQITSGPKLIGSIVPVSSEFIAPLMGVDACFDLVVSNRGHAETVITNIVILCYKSRLDRWRGKYVKQATILSSPPKYDLPYKIGLGHEFRCRLSLDAELKGWMQKYRAFVCVWHSMGDRPVHYRLKPIQDKPTQAPS
jgi:hypothetical protein